MDRPQTPTIEDLERMDVAVTEDPSTYDLERLQLEEGEVVGTTAIVDEKIEDLLFTDGPAPDPSKSEYDISRRS